MANPDENNLRAQSYSSLLVTVCSLLLCSWRRVKVNCSRCSIGAKNRPTGGAYGMFAPLYFLRKKIHKSKSFYSFKKDTFNALIISLNAKQNTFQSEVLSGILSLFSVVNKPSSCTMDLLYRIWPCFSACHRFLFEDKSSISAALIAFCEQNCRRSSSHIQQKSNR